MEDCEGLVGRLLDLCDGVGRDGRPNPTQDACDRFRDSIKKQRIAVINPSAVTAPPFADGSIPISTIGTHMETLIRKRIGAMPCSRCKARVVRLNLQTIEQAQAGRVELIAEMKKDAVKSAAKWWLKVVAAADQYLDLGGTEYLLNWCLDDALAMEAEAQANAAQDNNTAMDAENV
jgi:hypothetical protein